MTLFQTDAGLTGFGKIKIYSLKEACNKNLTATFKLKEFACMDKSDTIMMHEEFV